MNTLTRPDFESAFNAFLAQAQAIVDKHIAESKFPFRRTLRVERGKRYIRVVADEDSGASRYAYCFVDTTNGDILKAASWKGPAKGPRGNVFTTKNAEEAVNWYGALYR